MTTSPLLDVVLDSKRLAAASKEAYAYAVRSFLRFAGPDPATWRIETVEAWRDRLADHRGLAPQTVNCMLAGLRWASRSWVARDPSRHDFAGAEPLRHGDPRRPPHVPTHAEVRQLLASCHGYQPADLRDRALLTLAFRSGLRRSSLVRVTIDYAKQDSFQIAGKRGRVALVVVDGQIREAIEPWIQWLQSQGVVEGPLFRSLIDVPGRWLSPLSSSGVYLIMRTRAVGIGRGRLHPHSARHFFVSWCRAAGMPDWLIATRTGHAPSRTGEVPMLRHYTSPHLVEHGSIPPTL